MSVIYLTYFHFIALKISKILKTGLKSMGKSVLSWEHSFDRCFSEPSFNRLCSKLIEIAVYILNAKLI